MFILIKKFKGASKVKQQVIFNVERAQRSNFIRREFHADGHSRYDLEQRKPGQNFIRKSICVIIYDITDIDNHWLAFIISSIRQRLDKIFEYKNQIENLCVKLKIAFVNVESSLWIYFCLSGTETNLFVVVICF